MTDDKEIKALEAVSRALAGLDEETARRVVQWAAWRYGVAEDDDD